MVYINRYSQIALCVLIDALYGHDNWIEMKRPIRMKYKKKVNNINKYK